MVCRSVLPVFAAIGLLSLTVLSACSGQPAKEQVPVTDTQQRPSELPAGVKSSASNGDDVKSQQEVLISQLLYEANEALIRNRLTSPAYDNAYDRFQKVLAIDSRNEPARIGVKRIGRRYLTLSKEADLRGDREKALYYVRIAARVDPNYTAIRHMQAYLEASEVNEVTSGNIFYLNRAELALRNEVIKAKLAEIAGKAQRIDSRLLIVGRNDAEARWIYQQMRNATSNYRLRGNIEYADRPKVVLLDAPADKNK